MAEGWEGRGKGWREKTGARYLLTVANPQEHIHASNGKLRQLPVVSTVCRLGVATVSRVAPTRFFAREKLNFYYRLPAKTRTRL
jgi:hypothetical protein